MSEAGQSSGQPGTPGIPVKKRGGFPFRKKAPVEPEPESPEAREAREAAERAAAAEAARIEAIGTAWAHLGDRARAAFAGAPADDHRLIYLLSLVRQGREAEERGRITVSDHCRACIVRALEARVSERSHASLSAPSAPLTSGKAAPAPTALSRLKDRWEAAARERAAALLARHARRLAPAEQEAYSASLEALSSAAAGSTGGAQSLRRKLVDRLLRAESYRRRGARLSGWKTTPVPVNGPAGPYNDFVALEQTVQRLAQQHPEWAAEFLDLYGDMLKIRSAYNGLLPASKK